MLIYLFCFGASIFFENMALKYKNSRVSFWIFTIVSISIIVIVSGCRDYTVGNDVNGYRNYHWIVACKSKNIISLIDKLDTEPLFSVLLFVTSRFTDDFHFFLALTQLIIISCIYFGAWQYREYISPSWILVIYYFLFYNESLNIMRQHIAMAIVFAGFSYVENNKYRKYLIFLLIAYLFHNSAIIAILPMLIHLILYDNKSKLKEKSLHLKIFIIIGVLFTLASIKPIYNLLSSFGILRSAYSYYLDKSEVISSNFILLLLFIEIVILSINHEYYSLADKSYDYYILNMYICFISFMLSPVIYLSSRLSNYLWIFNVILYSKMILRLTNEKSKLISEILTITICFVYWYRIYILSLSGNTYPYSSEILSKFF